MRLADEAEAEVNPGVPDLLIDTPLVLNIKKILKDPYLIRIDRFTGWTISSGMHYFIDCKSADVRSEKRLCSNAPLVSTGQNSLGEFLRTPSFEF